jgi:hypothetical protein
VDPAGAVKKAKEIAELIEKDLDKQYNNDDYDNEVDPEHNKKVYNVYYDHLYPLQEKLKKIKADNPATIQHMLNALITLLQ